MARKSKPLLLLLYSFPSSVLAIIANSVLVLYLGSAEKVSLWLSMLPLLTALVAMLGTAATGGTLIADNIKAKAGLLGVKDES